MKVTMEEQKLYDDFTVSVFQRGYEKGKEDATISYQNAYNEGHVDGYAKGLNDRKKEIEKAKREGYDEGVTDTIFNTDTYTQGLNDAWDCARKLIVVESEGGLPIREQLEIFDNTFPVEVLKKYTASEAIAKIKEYENKRRPNCSYLKNICPYDIKCVDCEVFCSIKRGRDKIKELKGEE
jgi:hypothetical protein